MDRSITQLGTGDVVEVLSTRLRSWDWTRFGDRFERGWLIGMIVARLDGTRDWARYTILIPELGLNEVQAVAGTDDPGIRLGVQSPAPGGRI